MIARGGSKSWQSNSVCVRPCGASRNCAHALLGLGRSWPYHWAAVLCDETRQWPFSRPYKMTSRYKRCTEYLCFTVLSNDGQLRGEQVATASFRHAQAGSYSSETERRLASCHAPEPVALFGELCVESMNHDSLHFLHSYNQYCSPFRAHCLAVPPHEPNTSARNCVCLPITQVLSVPVAVVRPLRWAPRWPGLSVRED
jgi:hypothetical protein